MVTGALLLIPLLRRWPSSLAPVRHARWIALIGDRRTDVRLQPVVALTFRHWYDGGFGFTGTASWLGQFGVQIELRCRHRVAAARAADDACSCRCA